MSVPIVGLLECRALSWQSMIRTHCVCFGAMHSLQTSDRVNVSSRVRKRDGS